MENVPRHAHTGIDSPKVLYADILDRSWYIHHTVNDTDAASSAKYGVFWTAPFPGYVKSVTEVHSTAGSDGGAVTMNIEKLTSGTAEGAGSDLLSTEFNLKSTADIPVTGTFTQTQSIKKFNKGDRFALVPTGTLTAVNNVTIVLEVIF